MTLPPGCLRCTDRCGRAWAPSAGAPTNSRPVCSRLRLSQPGRPGRRGRRPPRCGPTPADPPVWPVPAARGKWASQPLGLGALLALLAGPRALLLLAWCSACWGCLHRPLLEAPSAANAPLSLSALPLSLRTHALCLPGLATPRGRHRLSRWTPPARPRPPRLPALRRLSSCPGSQNVPHPWASATPGPRALCRLMWRGLLESCSPRWRDSTSLLVLAPPGLWPPEETRAPTLDRRPFQEKSTSDCAWALPLVPVPVLALPGGMASAPGPWQAGQQWPVLGEAGEEARPGLS